ncbi:MAG: hypothetical protein FK733_17905 [Asgard group archaeon]|nr:hypothetical protein [Asgard group archaeon]
MELVTDENNVENKIKDRKLFLIEKRINMRLIASIILAVFGITILSLLISYVPLLERIIRSPTEQNFDGSNFFYNWFYSEGYYGGQWNYEFYLAKASRGYFIFTPLAIVMLILSGSTILCRKYQYAKIVIFINWILYPVPIIIAIVRSVTTQFNYSFNDNIELFIFGLMLFPILLNLMLQLGILTFKQDFFSLLMIRKNDNQIEIPIIRKIIICSIFLGSYLICAVFPLTLMRQIDLMKSTSIFLSCIWFLPIFWFVLLVCFKNQLVIRRFVLEIIAISLPIIIIYAAIFSFDSIVSGISKFNDLIFDLFRDIRYPIILWALTIKITAGLLIGFIIGFFSIKNVRLIILGAYVGLTLFYYIAWLGLPLSFTYYTISMKVYGVFNPYISCVTITIGFSLGMYLSQDYWKYESIVSKRKKLK